MALETNKQYDTIVATIMQNILSERAIADKIILWDFQIDQDVDRLYFNIASIISDLNNENMYMQMPLIPYIKMKWKRRKTRKNLRYVWPWMKKNLPNEVKTSIYIIMDYVRDYYKIDISKFKDINDEYYGWIE